MKFQEAVKKSIEMFLDGKMPDRTAELAESGQLMFTQEYFDLLEEEIMGEPVEKEEEVEDAS
jgi:phosphatidate phosphatase PAH1